MAAYKGIIGLLLALLRRRPGCRTASIPEKAVSSTSSFLELTLLILGRIHSSSYDIDGIAVFL